MKTAGKAAAAIGILIAAFHVQAADARVLVFDAATGVGSPVILRIQTRGAVLSAGGVRARITVGEAPAGSLLTGADGFGYLKFTPTAAGLLTVVARTEEESGSGSLLVTKADEPVILVDVDGAVRQNPLSLSSRPQAGPHLKTLAETYRVVYIAGMLGSLLDRVWITSAGLPESVVLPLDGAASLKALRKRGLRLHAAVGGARLLRASEGVVPHRFGFDAADRDLRVKDWKEVIERLQPSD